MFQAMRRDPPWEDHLSGDGFPRPRANSGSASSGGEERVIPIHIVKDDSPQKEVPRSQQVPQQQQQQSVDSQSGKRKPQIYGTHRSCTDSAAPSNVVNNLKAEETRNTRAQSAPPGLDEQLGDPNPVSKGNIETVPPVTQVGGNSSKSSNANSSSTKSNNASNTTGGIRNIPIFMEGKGSKPAASNNTSPQRNGPHQNSQSPNQQQPQPKCSRPAERSQTPPAKKAATPMDPIEKITIVINEVREWEQKVKDFKGTSREDKEYMLIDEMLTRNLIKLDTVETAGRDDVRNYRKECIKLIQKCISALEEKVPLPQQEDENNQVALVESMDVDSSQPPQGELVVSGSDTTVTAEQKNEENMNESAPVPDQGAQVVDTKSEATSSSEIPVDANDASGGTDVDTNASAV